MSAIETLRAILVGATVVTAVLAAGFGRWSTAVILAVAVLVHGYVTLYLRRLRVAQGGSAPPAPPPGPAL
jgi:hypothetical protein